MMINANDAELSRLLAGDVPIDDPELGPVSAFLGDLRTACPPVPVTSVEAHHLAAIAREARVVSAARQARPTPRRARLRTRRLLATALTATVGVLAAGVGVATALGANPLQNLIPVLLLEPPAGQVRTPPAASRDTAGSAVSTATDHSGKASAQPASAQPASAAPASTSPSPTPSQTTTPGKSGDNPGNPRSQTTQSNNGKATKSKANTKKKAGTKKPSKAATVRPKQSRPSAAPVVGEPGNGK